MRISAFCLLVLLLSAFAGGLSVRAESLASMDAVLVKAGSLDKFLASRELQDEYYAKLSAYYGGPEKAPREAYDQILAQLRVARWSVPELGARLWESNGLGEPMRIEAALRASGLTLKGDEWNEFLETKKNELARLSSSFESSGGGNVDERLRQYFDQAEQKIEEFEARLNSEPRANRGALSKAFYREMLESPALREAGALVVGRKLGDEAISDLLHSGDADVVLTTWAELQSKGSLETNTLQIPKRLQSLIVRAHLPALDVPPLKVNDDLPAETKLFRVATRLTNREKLVPLGVGSSEYKFVPLLRRFHGIFKGLPTKECVGGACASLDSLSPERWLTVALRDTRLWSVEREGSYLGFVQISPVRVGGKLYGSVDFGASVLANRVTIDTPEGSKLRSMLQVWLAEAMKKLPPSWQGLVVGENTAVNNAGVLSVVHASLEYLLGDTLQGEARSPDTLVRKIARILRPRRLAKEYAGNMIFDATVPRSGDLHVLRELPPGTDEALNEAEAVTRILADQDPIVSKDGLLKWAVRQKKLPPATSGLLLTSLATAEPFPANLYNLDQFLRDKNLVARQPADLFRIALRAVQNGGNLGIAYAAIPLLKGIPDAADRELLAWNYLNELLPRTHAWGALALNSSEQVNLFIIKSPERKEALAHLLLRNARDFGLDEVSEKLFSHNFLPGELAPLVAELMHSQAPADEKIWIKLAQIGQLNESVEAELLRRAIGNPHSKAAKIARTALMEAATHGDHKLHRNTLAALAALLQSPDPRLRTMAAECFAKYRGSAEELAEFIPALDLAAQEKPTWMMREKARNGWRQRVARAVETLSKARATPSAKLRQSIRDLPDADKRIISAFLGDKKTEAISSELRLSDAEKSSDSCGGLFGRRFRR